MGRAQDETGRKDMEQGGTVGGVGFTEGLGIASACMGKHGDEVEGQVEEGGEKRCRYHFSS